jgi:acetylornithine/N-succinyldiaminopimelate aminotransferase
MFVSVLGGTNPEDQTMQPIPVLAPAAASEFASLMEITERPDIVFVRGEGSWLFDRAGRRYLDFVQGWAVNCLGHSPVSLVRAIADQAARLISCSPAFHNEPMIRLADGLARAAGLDRVFFANCGAEANEGAIKLARKWGATHRGGAYGIVTMEHGFHGRTLATMSASGKAAFLDFVVEVVRRTDSEPGFKVIPPQVGRRTILRMADPLSPLGTRL